MGYQAALSAFCSTGFFSSRAFLPAFLFSLLLAHGHALPFISELELIQQASDHPNWFIHPITQIVLGVLTVLEFYAEKNPDLQQLLLKVDRYSKTAVSALCFLGILSASDASFIQELNTTPELERGNLAAFGIVAFFSAIVFLLSSFRASLLGFLASLDPADDLGLRKWISYCEDSWVGFGCFFVLLYPPIMLALLGFILLTLFLIKRHLAKREELKKVQCQACDSMIQPCAIACYNCQVSVEGIKDIGFLGQSLEREAPDLAEHSFHLVEKRRCPKCAERIHDCKIDISCRNCDERIFNSGEFFDQYQKRAGSRLTKCLLICLALSSVPVLGLIPAILYYRFQLINPYRAYMPWRGRFFLDLFLRIVLFVMIVAQAVPGFGILSMPILAFVSHWMYQSSFEGLRDRIASEEKASSS